MASASVASSLQQSLVLVLACLSVLTFILSLFYSIPAFFICYISDIVWPLPPPAVSDRGSPPLLISPQSVSFLSSSHRAVENRAQSSTWPRNQIIRGSHTVSLGLFTLTQQKCRLTYSTPSAPSPRCSRRPSSGGQRLNGRRRPFHPVSLHRRNPPH